MSKFLSAMNAAKDRSTSVAESFDKQALSQPAAVATPVPQLVPQLRAEALEPAPRRGRPAGKRSNQASVQVTAYIQADTHFAVKIALLKNSRRDGTRQDFSDLVQSLLATWLTSQQPDNDQAAR